MRLPLPIEEKAAQVIALAARAKKKIVTAESCTGGLIAAALTAIPGASAVLERGFVTYSPESKTEVLGLLPEAIERFGVVSAQTAEGMAHGALTFSRADIALSVTGIAGPSGGAEKTPVGLVFFGLATRDGACFHLRDAFAGDRDTVRERAVLAGLDLLAASLLPIDS